MILKWSSSDPQVILKWSSSYPQVIWSNLTPSNAIRSNQIQSDPIWSNFKGFISFLKIAFCQTSTFHGKFWTKVVNPTKWIVGPLWRASRSKTWLNLHQWIYPHQFFFFKASGPALNLGACWSLLFVNLPSLNFTLFRIFMFL